jgi:tripartite-type tricarboxylate transporter receptor subunit TctC
MNARMPVVVRLLALLFAAPGLAAAQAYPAKTMRIIVPFPPGAATDLTGRFVAQRLNEALGQQVIVDNRPGANGTIGLELAAKAPPDGYTLVIGQTGNLAISPGLTRVGYDPARDFAPISLLIASPHVLAVHPSLPVKTFKEAIAFARARPGELNYASTGSGSAGHLGMELLKKAAGINVVHIPYKGGLPGLMDLAAGHVVMMFTSVLSTAQVGNRVRRLAVGSLQRSPSLPDVPTIAESGYPGFEVISWWGILTQAAVPKEIVARLHGEVVKAMASAEAQKRIGALGADIKTSDPAEFAAYIRSEQAKWGQAIKDSGARVD